MGRKLGTERNRAPNHKAAGTKSKQAREAERAPRKPRASRRKPGRPKGSIRKLTPEERALLLTVIENGATDHAAARVVGMDARTFRRHRAIAEGGEDHPEKDYLIKLYGEIDAAQARARVRQEIEVATRHPKDWLRHQAPSEPGLPGWTARVPDEEAEGAAPIYAPTPEEMAATIRILIQSGAVPDPFKEEHDDETEEHPDQEPSD